MNDGDIIEFNNSVLKFVGTLVATRPVYGWGWTGTQGTPIEVPEPFHFAVSEFFDWNGQRRGGIGLVRENGHVYDGLWILFYNRNLGSYDFQRRIACCNFHLGLHRPTLHPPSHDPEMAKFWPLVNFPADSTADGMGWIAADPDLFDIIEAQSLTSPKTGN